MGNKRKRDDDSDDEIDYDKFCQNLGATCSKGLPENSFVYSSDKRVKRHKVNPNFYPVKCAAAPVVLYYELSEFDDNFKRIKKLVRNRNIIIDSIIEVHNELLEINYKRKKEEKLTEFGVVKEELVFHGTKDINVESICKYNFDWRLYGRKTGNHKFGKGVNFSTNAMYASAYCAPNSYVKVMIVAKVLVGNVCRGDNNMSLPPKGYDTSQKGQNGVVMVKYDDNEFFPAYIVYFHYRGRCNYYSSNNRNPSNQKFNTYNNYHYNHHELQFFANDNRYEYGYPYDRYNYQKYGHSHHNDRRHRYGYYHYDAHYHSGHDRYYDRYDFRRN